MNGVVIVISLRTLRSSSLPTFFFHIAQKTGKNAGSLLKKQAKISILRAFWKVSLLPKCHAPYGNQCSYTFGKVFANAVCEVNIPHCFSTFTWN